MASASVNAHASTKETTNYARLCRLLVDVGREALRATFDKIHPPASLHDKLSSHPVRASLERLQKGNHKILHPTQWEKLYPSYHSSVSSRDFDVTLLMVLLKNFSGLKPPAGGWNSAPPAKDTSTEADIIRLRVFRDEIYDHARKAYVDDHKFYEYWQDIQQTLIRLGGERCRPFIDRLKVDCVDPDIGLHYQELLKQWKEDESRIDEIEGNVGCLYADTEDISLLDPTVDFKSTLKHGMAKEAQRRVIKYLSSERERKAPICSTDAACGKKVLQQFSTKNGVNRITSDMFHTEEERKGNEIVMRLLDEAINLQQSDHIADSREKLQHVFQIVKDFGQRFFRNPTTDGLRVLRLGKELFLEDSVCCSVKHGTLLLDSSNSETQYYSSLLNVIGAFAVVISEFKMAKETYSLLIDFHQQSAVTCRKRDLGAAYNNTGCVSLITGDLRTAECDFKTSLEHLESARERHQPHSPPLETMFIAIKSNIGRLHLISRNYSKAIEKQVVLVETCKTKEVKALPLQIVFTLLNNLAVSYTTLGKFSKAEHELKWMVSYCKMKRKNCDFLLNFVGLHLSEVLLIHGKPKEAEKAFTLDVDDIDLVEMFGGLHINVLIETVEKLVDVIALKGKIRFACELLETSVNILERTFGPDHFNVASLLYKQGTILALAGEVSNAEEKFKCSRKVLEEIFGIKHPLLLKCYMSLGELALRSKRVDESYFYFQRTMENIEAIYQVSFVNQLSRKYLEITSSNTFHQSKTLEDTWKIESLVAEHGVVLAVLLSRPVVQDDIPPLRRTKTKLKQHLSTNHRDVQCPDTKEIVSFKYTSDFLQTGQIFLREGMKKEAAAFFQQARKYSMALDATRGPAYACIARLFDVLTEKRLGNRETLENKHETFKCLKELNEFSAKITNEISSKRSTEEATTTTPAATATASTRVTCDDQLNLKLVLIFLILLSIKLKMIDTTFAVYDLYSRISLNEDGFLHVLNGEVQVYASKTSISCNGKTALQDVLVSSAVGLNEIDPQQPLPDGELYRSLALKRNAQTDSFLVAYTSSVLLDIEELRALDRKVSLSVQECFQQKCFETGVEDSATQVVVDLTKTTSICEHHNVLLAGSRVKLLSLCLLQETISEIPHGGSILEISTAMCQKTFRLTFEDEQTGYFMFSKNALYLQQCSSVKFSTLSVQHHCLSLTITHPVKARVTLWHKDRTISQKVQFVQTKRHDMMAGWTVPRQGCSADLIGNCAAVKTLFLPAINHLANVDRVPCKTTECSDEPPDVSDVHCEQSGFLLNGPQVSLRMEKSEALRNNLNAITLETLTNVSELSSQLCEDAIQEGDNDFAAEAHRVNISRLRTFSQRQLEQEATSSERSIQPSTLIPETNIQSRHSSFDAPNAAGEEETPETYETYPTLREEDDDNLLGRRLFEKDKDSRRSLITELHHKMTRKSNLMSQEDDPSVEVTHQVGSRVIDLQNAATCQTATSHNGQTRKDITNGSFNWTLNPTAELRDPNLMEEQSKSDPKDDEDALERPLLERDTHSTGSSIVESKRSKKGDVLPTWNNKIQANEDSVEDQGLYENQQFESSPVPGQSARMAKDEVKQSLTGTAMNDSKTQIRTENVTLDNQYRSNYLSSTYGQTQHLQDVIERQTKDTILEGENHETPSPEYLFRQRDEREGHDGQNEPLVHKDFPQAFTIPNLTKREKSRSSLNVYDDTVPDGPIRTSNGMHDSSTDLMPSGYTDVVDGPLKRVGNNLQIQTGLLSENANGMLTSRRQIVDETNCEELHPGTRRNDKLRASHRSFRNPQFAFLGGDVLVDGAATDSPRKGDKVVNGPALKTVEAFTTCQDGTERICKNEIKPFPSDASRDAVDGRVYSLRSEDPRGFGGARPKQISPNFTSRNSPTKTKITEPISTYQHNDTGDIGLKPGFLARHTVKSNGAVLDLPPQDGWNESNFSAQSCKNTTYGDNLQLPGEGINSPSYRSISSGQGLYAQAAFAARTSTRSTAQSPAIHQEPSLNQKESWHFPPPESPNGEQSLCLSQQNASQFENVFISNVKALFSSHGSRSAYDEMDSMSDEYQNSMGNVDNTMVKPPATSCGYYSSTKDSTSSLLGSLQQMMSKTVNLIASSNVVAKQPQKESKEAVKLSIQEEARGSRGQEQAVRKGAEDSRNLGESPQDKEKTERQPILTPVQETPRPVCSHYQRRCLVRFPCCGKFYPCHRCHNESKDCSDDQARASNATHIRCSICYHEQVIDQQSQNCGGCKSKMSEYFCATCKHFTSVDKNPFHCDKCGICRIHRDRSFHCDVCNVCLDKRLQGKHKCRPDSGHDECCICLEDAFSGCQILPCSHKVHKDCAIAMIQNGVRSCPICRHPLFSHPQNSPQ